MFLSAPRRNSFMNRFSKNTVFHREVFAEQCDYAVIENRLGNHGFTHH